MIKITLIQMIKEASPILIGGAVVMATIVMLWDYQWGIFSKRNRRKKQ